MLFRLLYVLLGLNPWVLHGGGRGKLETMNDLTLQGQFANHEIGYVLVQ